jgi:hypothetical protein
MLAAPVNPTGPAAEQVDEHVIDRYRVAWQPSVEEVNAGEEVLCEALDLCEPDGYWRHLVVALLVKAHEADR